jgi:hypothetical protein
MMNVKVFDSLHISEDAAHSSDDKSRNMVRLHCFDVWYSTQLPWQPFKIEFELVDQVGESYSHWNQSCLFSVVQSSSGVSPSAILREVEKIIHQNLDPTVGSD